MKLSATFEEVSDLQLLADSRKAYLDGLAEAQELAIEVLVGSSRGYAIRTTDGELCGHALVHADAGVIEFHLARPYWVFGQQLLGELLQHTGEKKARIKTFDALFLTSALPLQSRVTTLGLLCRDHVPRPAEELACEPFTSRMATEDDWDAVWEVDQSVFRNPQRLRAVLAAGRVRLFERDGKAIGFGIENPVREGHAAVEIGIALDSSVRGQRQSAALIHHQIAATQQQGRKPVAGCAIGNHASRAMGERAGFVARYQLLELEF